MERSQALVYLLISCLLNPYFGTTSEFSAIEIFRKYCPGIKTCTEPDNMTEDDLMDGPSCCQSCTCDEHCWDRGNCCPDVRFPYRPSTVECVAKKSSYNYFITETCPDGQTSIESMICENEADPRLFVDAVLVSDTNNSMVFRNRFCAECNGILNYVPWKIASLRESNNRCTDSNSELLQNVSRLEDCGVISVRPNEEIHNNAVCHMENIVTLTDCPPSSNSTIRWYYELCERYKIPAFFNNNINNDSKIYRNIYCYLCNTMTKGRTPEMCGGQAIRLFPGTRLIQSTVPFTKIFNFIDSEVDGKAVVCEEDELFDEYQMRCLPFSCAFGYLRQNGTCKRNMLESTNIQFRMKIEFTSVFGRSILINSTTAVIYIAEAKRMISSIRPCQFANEEAWIYTDIENVDSLLWQFEIYTSFKCQDEDVEDIMHHLQNNEVVIKDETFSNTSTFLIKPVFFSSNVSSKLVKANLSIDKNAIDFEHQEVLVDAVTFCTSIALTEDMLTDLEDTILNHHDKNTKGINDLADKLAYHDDVYEICHDYYVDIRKALKSLKSPKPAYASGYLSLACTFVSIICAGFTVVVNLLFDRSNSLPNYIMRLVCLNLILAQSMFQFGIGAEVSGFPCILIGICIHSFWLAHALSMNAFVFGVVFTLRQRVTSTSLSYLKILVYALYIYLTPLICVTLNIIISKLTTSNVNTGYGEGSEGLCYISTAFSRLVFFVVPILTIVGLNLCGYVYFVWLMIKERMDSGVLQSQRLYLQAYVRLSCVTGTTWLFGVLSEFIEAEVFEYLFVLTNCGQGILLLVAFGRLKNVYLIIKSRAFVSTASISDSKGDK